MGFSVDHLLELLAAYKYLIIFPVAILEGPVLAMLSGFLVSEEVLNPLLTYGLLLLADLVGDSLYYFLGYFGGNAFFKKYGYWFGVDQAKLLELEKNFKEYGIRLLLFGKTQVFGTVILAASGVGKMNYPLFLLINLLGSAVKIFGFLLIGYFFGEATSEINNLFNKIGLLSALIVGVLGVIYLLRKRRSR